MAERAAATQLPGRFAHPCGFGAEMADGIRFRLWAPDCERIGLVDVERDRVLPMRAEGQGWFACDGAGFAAGDRYLFELPDGLRVPDPAARAQAEDVHGASLLVDPLAHRWQHADWRGRPWAEAVLCELHVGCATPEGSFEGLRRRLSHYARTGITALELMPLADFPGRRGWGYDGVLPFAPDRSYGRPEDLKRLVDDAHGLGLMVFLDVVYNHFGPDGNYLHAYAEGFFDADRHTPWGPGIDFARPQVREFFIQNALYWLQEYRFDGLRLDAVNQIRDDSAEHFLVELARRVRAATAGREVHLVLENDDNAARLLERDAAGRPVLYTAQWNDDYHHAAHCLLTGEADGYYADYAAQPAGGLARALASGFIFQGEGSPYRDGTARGEASGGLPPLAFVNFLQNHDQVGNRALGERLTGLATASRVAAALQLLLLAPQVPLLFMGEEWGEVQPFLFFCDFHGDLGEAVRNGRRREFARFAQFRSPEARSRIPDPNRPETFQASRIDWDRRPAQPHAGRAALVRGLLQRRAAEVAPRLPRIGGHAGRSALDGALLQAAWQVADCEWLQVRANLSGDRHALPPAAIDREPPRRIWPDRDPEAGRALAPWSVCWSVGPLPPGLDA